MAAAPLSFDLSPAHLTRLFAGVAAARIVVLAVSGGPDSMALVHLAKRWTDPLPQPPALLAVTFDHGLRAGAAQEAAHVGAWCAALGVPHTTLHWQGAKPTTRVQERARDARYAALLAFAQYQDAEAVLTAHHADDQAETVLLRLSRGSGLAGLAGMAVARPLGPGVTLHRPLLGLPKQALVDLCHQLGQGFVDDPSNSNRAFARVRMRQMAARLAAEGLDRAALLRLAARAARAEAALQDATARLVQRMDAAGDVTALAAAPLELVVRFVLAKVLEVSGAAPRLERVETFAVRLQSAVAQASPLRANLGFCLFRLDAKGRLHVTPEPVRQRG